MWEWQWQVVRRRYYAHPLRQEVHPAGTSDSAPRCEAVGTP